MAYHLTTQLAVLEARKQASDEEYISTEQIVLKMKDPKQFQASMRSLWKLNRRQVGSKAQAIIRRIMGC